MLLRHVPAIHIRAAAAIDWAHILYDDHPRAGAIINIILDPIMIFGLLGFPKLGVAGAALATVIGQIVASILALLFNIKKNEEITLRLKGFRPNAKVIGKIYSVGIPSIIMASIGSVMTFGMNKILISFTSTATAVFGVYFKLQSFVLCRSLA